MPPKRKAAAAKAAPKVEEPATKVKKGRTKAEEKVEKNEEVELEKEEQEDVEQKSKSAVSKRKGKQTKEEKQANGKAEVTEEVKDENINGVDEENDEELEEKSSEKSGGKKGKAKPKGRKAKEVKSKKVEEDEMSEKADSEKSEELETANPSGSRKKRAAAEKPIPKDMDDDDEEEEAPKKRQRAAKGKASRKAKEATPEDDYEEEKPKRGRAKKAQTKDSDKESEAPLNKTETEWNEVEFECTKENAKGEKYNLKICSWNVDGLRAWIKKDGLKIFQYAKPDILCLQETKCSEDKHPDEIKNIEGYKQYWCGSEKEGYAGVALFSKIEPLNVKYGIDNEDQDSDGRCITAEYENFYLVGVYVPNAGRGLVTLPKRLEWNNLFMKHVKSLDEKKPVIICGDMNVAHNEIDLANPKTNTKNAGFTKEEREGMTEFLGEGFVDTYRKLYPDKEKAYTFWSYMTKARAKNVGWRLDYFIVSEKIIDNVCDNVINSNVFGSDHCPITLFINI